MSSARLSHVLLFVKRLDAMVEFYSAVFDLEPRATASAGFIEMVSGGEVMLALHALPAEVAATISVTSPAQWRDESATKLCFETDDLEGQRRIIQARGGQAQDPWEWDGRRFCECADPEGNVIQIFTRPA